MPGHEWDEGLAGPFHPSSCADDAPEREGHSHTAGKDFRAARRFEADGDNAGFFDGRIQPVLLHSLIFTCNIEITRTLIE